MNTRKYGFGRDNELYGKFGEADFKQYCKENGWYWIDVSNDLPYQLADIDFLMSKSQFSYEDDVKPYERDILFSRELKEYNDDGTIKKERKIYKFEVKADTRSFKTRNVLYEVISHDSAGCLGESKADFIYYVFVEEPEPGVLIKKEVWYINLPKWRKFLREKFFDSWVSRSDSADKYGIWTNNYTRVDENGKVLDAAGNILCDIEILEKNGIAKRVF